MMAQRFTDALAHPLISTRKLIGRTARLPIVPDEAALRLLYWAALGKRLDLVNPRSFNEKLQWLKLHDRRPEYTMLVDKCAVKQWVADRIGPEHVIRTYARWDRAEDIDITSLPEKFVLKTNHDSGGVVICKSRAEFDLKAARRKLAKSLRRNFFWVGREWPYKDVAPCIFAEEYLEPDAAGDLPDYKLFCFSNGKIVTLLMTDRFTEAGLTKTFFDENWRPLSLSEGNHPTRPEVPAPERFEEMKALAERLAAGFPFMRVDFYESEGRLLFGEMTFYPNSGFEHFNPKEWDVEFGSWIDLAGGGWLLVSDSALMWAHEAAHALPADDLTDYKFMCFGGEPRCAFTCTGRAEGDLRVDFFDEDWNHMPFTRHYPNANAPKAAPRKLREMQDFARALSAGIPFVRVDFYEQGDRVLFGEMTFYPGCGFEEFAPEEWDERLGSWIDLPGTNCEVPMRRRKALEASR